LTSDVRTVGTPEAGATDTLIGSLLFSFLGADFGHYFVVRATLE